MIGSRIPDLEQYLISVKPNLCNDNISRLVNYMNCSKSDVIVSFFNGLNDILVESGYRVFSFDEFKFIFLGERIGLDDFRLLYFDNKLV